MQDIITELTAVHRAVGRSTIAAGEARVVSLRRTYPAPVEEVWDVVTNPERIPRWFLPVTGDFRPGGTYQLQGNAGGEIRVCEAPHRLVLTWIFGENPTPADVTEVEVRLTADGDGRTILELDHAAVVSDDRWTEYGPGAVGVGWDGALLGIAVHLATGSDTPPDPMEWAMSPEGREFTTGSAQAWGEAAEVAGDPADEARAAMRNTLAAYLPPA
jgi:uncharacterized protein YndB with AHSA1/START domain